MARRRRLLTALLLVLGAGVLGLLAARVLPGGAEAQEAGGAEAREAGAASAQEAEAPAQVEGETAERAIVDHNTATRGPRQPIPFSHRFHATELGIDCMYCHVGTERSETGVVPSLEVCMGCHRTAGTGLEPIEELRGYWDRGEPVRWVWVNKLPDFVQFPHQPHIRSGVTCQECHGPVEEMARVYQWAPLTMGWCLDCHRSEPRETDVATDYRLIREHPIPQIPEGRQPLSLYPIRIETGYGEYRGPIDCFVCHH